MRFLRITRALQAFPRDLSPLKIPKNQNPEDRCGLLMFSESRCGGYVNFREKDDKTDHYLYTSYAKVFQENRKSNCLVFTYFGRCLYPKKEYNRELVEETNLLLYHPMEMLSEFEGDSPQAVAKREGRKLFIDNKGRKYWLRCPVDCKNHFFYYFYINP